jgi:hypothetical protein
MTEGDQLAKSIEAGIGPDHNNIKESVVTFCDANMGDDASPLSTSAGSTTRRIVVDATQHLEAGSTSSSKLMPGVNDMTQGVQDVVRNAKECVRMFRVDNEIFEVNVEQLDRVRMSKCSLEGSPQGRDSSTNGKCSSFLHCFMLL